MDVKLAEADKFLTYQDCYDYLFEKIFPLRPADYGSKYPKWPGLVGIEVEMLPLYTASLNKSTPDTVPLYEGGKSLVDMLYSMQAGRSDWRFVDVPEGSKHLMNVLLEDEDQLSFEPGGQLEFSSKPYPCLSDALARTRAMQATVDEAAKAHGITILQVGMNPWRSVDEIGLQMNKPRYQAMDSFFARQGVHGQRMMRQTCTIQLNLDFGGCEDTLAKRYIVGNLIAPFATATFANSPFLDGKLNGLLSNRGDTWQHMDPTRTGFPNLDDVIKLRTRKACVEAYLDWIMKGRVIFSERHAFEVMDGTFNFGDWVEKGYKGLKPTLKDLQTHLSLQFPEVRARGFLELRSVDAQHRYWQAAPGAYYTGIIYDDKSLDDTLELLLPEFPRLTELWQKAPTGLQDKDIARLSKRVVEIAIEGFSRMPPCYHGGEATHILTDFYHRYTEKSLTPADEIVRKFKAQGKFTGQDLIDLENDWKKTV
ncbi:MAG: hypothetical protein EOP10_09950 [Proteobacteria bacterium]|nr:MAG: hypothetical protein EOP10_09950 [Pseudomonadota bacterium]